MNRVLFACLLLLLTVNSALSADRPASEWNEVALNIIRKIVIAPPVVARAYAIAHTCMFDAWAAYSPRAIGVFSGSEYRRPAEEHTRENKLKAVSYAARRCFKDLIPQGGSAFDEELARRGYDPAINSNDATTPEGIGNIVAELALAARSVDGSNQKGNLYSGNYSDYTAYAPVNSWDFIADPNRWQALRVPNGNGGYNVQQFALPHWGNVKTFSGKHPSALDDYLPVPKCYGVENSKGEEEFFTQTEEVVRISGELNDRTKSIAEYWAGGPRSETPPGHWCMLSQHVSASKNYDIDQDVQLFFVLGNGLMDAGIACWYLKRRFDSVRPVTTVRYLFKDKLIRAWGGPSKGTETILGQFFQPYQALNFVTPPFAEYPSGHSTFSRASAELLALFTGSNSFKHGAVWAKGSSQIEPGTTPTADVTLYWETYQDAAEEAGISRLYGGIHFEMGNVGGQELGKEVAKAVWAKAQTYINP